MPFFRLPPDAGKRNQNRCLHSLSSGHRTASERRKIRVSFGISAKPDRVRRVSGIRWNQKISVLCLSGCVRHSCARRMGCADAQQVHFCRRRLLRIRHHPARIRAQAAVAHPARFLSAGHRPAVPPMGRLLQGIPAPAQQKLLLVLHRSLGRQIGGHSAEMNETGSAPWTSAKQSAAKPDAFK